jgi:hypothetical protein
MAYTIVPASGRSTAIVNLEATPPVRASAGMGGTARTVCIEGYGLAPINMPTTDFLPLVRVPSQAIIKKVEIALDTAPSTSLTGAIGLLFSDCNDGTPQSLQSTYALTGSVPSFVAQSFFFYNAAITSYVGLWTDVTFQNYTGNSVTDGFYVPSAAGKPLWQALTAGGSVAGLGKATVNGANTGSSPGTAFANCQTDPGGFMDVTWFETTTGVNTSAVTINLRVTYAEAAANL